MLKLLLLLILVGSISANSLKKANRYYKNNNHKKATLYFKKACDEGIKEGCDKYDELQSPIIKAFTLISQNRGEEALVFLKIACQEGFTRGCTIYESSTGKSIAPPKEHAYFKKIVDYMIEEKSQSKEEATKVAVRYIWGKPILSNLKYNRDEHYFTANLKFDKNKNFNKNITILIPKDKVKTFKIAFTSLKPEAVFNVNGTNIKLKKIQIAYLNENYLVNF